MTSTKTDQTKIKPNTFFAFRINNTKYEFNLRSLFLTAVLVVFIAFELFFAGGYVDEVFGIFALGMLLILIGKLKKNDLVSMILLLSTVALGLLSNITSGVTVAKSSIFIDVLTQIKVILAFYFVKSFFTDREKQSVLDLLLPISKLFCIVTFVLSVASQFTNLGMSPDRRYGLNCFNFVFAFNFEYIATYMVVFATFVCSNKLSKNQKLIYYFMALVAIALNLKSEAIIFAAAYIFLFFYLRKHQKLNIFVILLLIGGVVFLGQFQIDNYLAKEGTARHEFFVYAFKNANDHFPFGSGFATYGSAEAAKHYSPLYYDYGFHKIWGMTPDANGTFLNDTYWASIIGQFGYIGTLLIGLVYISIFFIFTNKNYKFDQKAFLYANFAQYVIHAIGAGIITSSSGMIGFMAMALVCQNGSEVDLTSKIPTLNINFRR